MRAHLALLVATLAACSPRASAPKTDATPRSAPLGVPEPPGPLAPEGPVRVVHGAPLGETDGQGEVQVVFDRPMVAIGTDTGAAGVLSLVPAVPGEAYWMGTQTLVFRPAGGFPMATSFEAQLSPTLRALDGQGLGEPFALAFGTPPPSVVRASPYDGARGEEPTRAFELFFDQRVSSDALTRALRVEVVKRGVLKTHPVRVERPDAGDLKRLRVVPASPWPKAAEVRVRVSAGLVGDEGPRPMASAFAMAFHTYDPLAFVSTAPCAQREGGLCAPGDGVSIRFTNPVKLARAVQALVFDPPLAEPLDAASYSDYTDDSLYVYGGLKPLTSYTVTLQKPLVDVHGQRFGGPRSLRFQTSGYEPTVWLPSTGELAEAGTHPQLPLALRNVQGASVRITRLGEQPLARLLAARASDDGEALAAAQPVLRERLPDVGPAEERAHRLDVARALNDGRGVLHVEVTKGSGAREELLADRLIAYTALAPTLKAGATGGAVWVTRFADAKPVAGASVHVVGCPGEELARGRTDARGVFSYRGASARCPVAAVVSAQHDVAFVRQYDGEGPWSLTEHAEPDSGGDVDALVFSERGVYRPGEEVHLKVVARKLGATGLALPSEPVDVAVEDARGRALYAVRAPLSEFGSADAAFRLPLDVALGPFTARVKLGDQSFTHTAEVAEFRRAELTTEVSAAESRIVSGENAELSVRAEYLFGAKVSGAPVTWAARRLESDVRPAGARFDGFAFDDARRLFGDILPADARELQSGEAKLDERGALALRVPLVTRSAGEPARYELEATVDGLGGATSSGRTFVDVTPASVMAAVRVDKTLAGVGEAVSADVLAVSPEGADAAGVVLSVRLERRAYREQARLDETGARITERVRDDVVVERCKRTMGPGLTPCVLKPAAAGLHFVHVEARDARGRLSEASAVLYVYGEGARDEAASDAFAVRAQKSTYRQGETARVVVTSPFAEAEALVTVERDTVLSSERHTVHGGALVLDVPVDARFVPNAFVSVLLVRARGPKSEADDGRPDFRVGVVELSTDTSERRLSVAVTPSAAVTTPGAELSVDVAVADAAGRAKSAELALFAVDEGVLMLTGYRTPDPYAHFYRPRGLSVWTADARSLLVAEDELDATLGEKGGGEAGGGGEAARSDFRALAFYAPSVVTDAQGRAQVRFKLPDSVTRYRVMAVAVGKGADFGSGSADVRTQKPLMLRPALPRVLRAGDALSAGVAVHNESDRALDVDVRAELSGVSLAGPAEAHVRVEAHGAQELRFALKAEQVGEARFTFSAQAGAQRDALTVTRPVRSPSQLESVASYGETRGQGAEQLAPLAGVRSDVGGLTVRVSTSAVSSLSEVAEALRTYPYACTEQLASRLYAQASLRSLAALKFAVPEPSDELVAQTLGALVKRQRGDGSFVLWPEQESRGPTPFAAFLTAYVLRALDAAHDAKLGDSAATREAAHAFLAGYLRDEQAEAGPERDELRAFVLASLAAGGRVDAAYLATLSERTASLSASGKAALYTAAVRARGVAGADALAARLLAELGQLLRMSADEAHLEVNVGDGYRVSLESDLRATSLLLDGLLTADPKHVLVSKLAHYLGSARGRDGTWGNTHDDAWGLWALGRYASVVERAVPRYRAEVRLGGAAVLDEALAGRGDGRTVEVPMAALAKGGTRVAFEKRGEGLLVYATRLSFARTALPEAPLERGFFMERSYEPVAPAALMGGGARSPASLSARVGDYVRVTLRVAVPAERAFVVIDDPLPAGLEPVSALFSTSSHAAERALGFADGPYDHRELFDDRVSYAVSQLAPGVYTYQYLARAVTPGSYVVPPAKAEEMYHPDTFGRTRAERFTVEAR
jgi:alpha-2-macroglobulin